MKNGSREGIRTDNLPGNNRLLYQLSYSGTINELQVLQPISHFGTLESIRKLSKESNQNCRHSCRAAVGV